MAHILISDNAYGYLNEHNPLTQYLSEIRHIHYSDMLDPCYFPWIYLVLEQKELQRNIHLMVSLSLSNLIL